MLQAYSGTPLAKKLGIKEGFKIRLMNQPTNYFELLGTLPNDIEFVSNKKGSKNLVHYFTKNAAQLNSDMASLREEVYPNGTIWISWPKKAAKVATDVDEDIIRHLALKNGLVDVKVCAVDEIWSGLKLVVPLKDRK